MLAGIALGPSLLGRVRPDWYAFLLPAFFAFAGMRTRIDLLSGASDWMACGVIVLIASAGKLGGCLAAAGTTGMQLRDAAALAVLMNTRGLIELVLLNIGLDWA